VINPNLILLRVLFFFPSLSPKLQNMVNPATKAAFAEPHRIYASTIERENNEIELLSKELKEMLKKEILCQK
jgi:hypothetical protein